MWSAIARATGTAGLRHVETFRIQYEYYFQKSKLLILSKFFKNNFQVIIVYKSITL